MNTKTNNKDLSKSSSLENQESNEVFNGNTDGSITALINRKERCGEKINNSIKETGEDRTSTKRKDIAPRAKASIDFAAEQWFRILLVHLNGKNDKYKDNIEPLPSAICV